MTIRDLPKPNALSEYEWSSWRIHKIMNWMIRRSLEPLFEACRLPDWYFSEVLHIFMTTPQRRASVANMADFADGLYKALFVSDSKQKASIIAEIQWDRGNVTCLLDSVERFWGLFMPAYKDWIMERDPVAKNIKRNVVNDLMYVVGAKDTIKFFNLMRRCLFWADALKRFKQAIASRFIMRILKEANQYVRRAQGMTMDPEEVAASMMARMEDAFNKYDARKGPFASYMQFWMQNAAAKSASHAQGVAIDVPTGTMKKILAEGGDGLRSGRGGHSLINNFGYGLDTALHIEDSAPTADVTTAADQDAKILARIAQASDVHGFALLVLGIPVDPFWTKVAEA